MTALTDEQYKQITESAGWNWDYMSDRERDMMRAVADAAIAADRAARAEPVAWIIQWDNDPDDVVTSMHNYDLQQALGAGWPIQYLYTAPPAAPAAPVVPNEEGRHCGDPDCVPCRDPAEPAGEQVRLTDAEIKEHFHHGSRTCKVSGPMNARDLAGIRQVIAAHEAKRASCSRNAKKSTHEAGHVDEIGKSEHVGGAA